MIYQEDIDLVKWKAKKKGAAWGMNLTLYPDPLVRECFLNRKPEIDANVSFIKLMILIAILSKKWCQIICPKNVIFGLFSIAALPSYNLSWSTLSWSCIWLLAHSLCLWLESSCHEGRWYCHSFSPQLHSPCPAQCPADIRHLANICGCY